MRKLFLIILFRKKEFNVLSDYLMLFDKKDEMKQEEILREMLLRDGFKEEKSKNYGVEGKSKTVWYSKEGVDKVVAFVENCRGLRLPMILPADFARHYYADEDGHFNKFVCVQENGYKNGMLVPKYKSVPLTYVLYEFYNTKIPEECTMIDHICHLRGVAILEELRPATTEQNRRNSINMRKTNVGDGFDYNPNHDFRDEFWIPCLHYVLGIITATEMDELKEMKLACSHQEGY